MLMVYGKCCYVFWEAEKYYFEKKTKLQHSADTPKRIYTYTTAALLLCTVKSIGCQFLLYGFDWIVLCIKLLLLLFSLYCYFKLFKIRCLLRHFCSKRITLTSLHFTSLHITVYDAIDMCMCIQFFMLLITLAARKTHTTSKFWSRFSLNICSRCLSLSIRLHSHQSFAVDIVFVCLTFKIKYCVAEGRILVEKSINFLLTEFNSKMTSNA